MPNTVQNATTPNRLSTADERSATVDPIPQPSKTITAGPGRRGSKTATLGSVVAMDYGRRAMKAYPITEGELSTLFSIGLGAAICFAFASASLGFAVDLHKDLAFSPDLSESIQAFWQNIQIVAWALMVVFFVAGCAFLFWGKNKLSEIKSGTTFDIK